METVLIVILTAALAATAAFLAGKKKAYEEMERTLQEARRNDLSDTEKDTVRQIINLMTYMGPNEKSGGEVE